MQNIYRFLDAMELSALATAMTFEAIENAIKNGPEYFVVIVSKSGDIFLDQGTRLPLGKLVGAGEQYTWQDFVFPLWSDLVMTSARKLAQLQKTQQVITKRFNLFVSNYETRTVQLVSAFGAQDSLEQRTRFVEPAIDEPGFAGWARYEVLKLHFAPGEWRDWIYIWPDADSENKPELHDGCESVDDLGREVMIEIYRDGHEVKFVVRLGELSAD